MDKAPPDIGAAPRIGMGCWAIGGALWAGDVPLGYAGTDDDESRRTIEAAWAAGVRVFDTAAVYGAGHSETLLGEVLGNRDGAIVVSKCGPVFDPATRQVTGQSNAPEDIRASALASRARLRRDRIDVLLSHTNTLGIAEVPAVFDTLAELREEGVIGSFGWSTDFPERLDAAAARPGFTVVEHTMNVFFDAPSLCAVAARHALTQVIRSPLAMGLLTGKFSAGQRLDPTDVRSNSMDWMEYFSDGVVSRSHLARLDAVRDLLTTGGRTPGQGALCWLLAKSPSVLPVPGARTVGQIEENAAAMDLGPLPADVMDEIERILDRPPEGPARER